MRSTILAILLSSLGWGQALVEHAAAAAGGSVGGVAGKKVSDGLNSIFGKIDKQTSKAAKGASAGTAASNAPLLEVGPGVPKATAPAAPASTVATATVAGYPPPPPPVRSATVHKAPASRVARVLPPAIPRIEPPESTPVTREELRLVTTGMQRPDVLRLGIPAAKITMYDDGHLVEIYRYHSNDTTIGAVRLTDGTVSSVVVQ
jgi:hypothetical protein